MPPLTEYHETARVPTAVFTLDAAKNLAKSSLYTPFDASVAIC
jgi:hypothetical protein